MRRGRYRNGAKRYYYFDSNGEKVIKEFVEPPSDPKWLKGNGPLSPQHYSVLLERMERIFKGVPKTQSQRQKMAEAKLGIPKSEEHRNSMREAHLERAARVKQLQQEHPELSYNEANRMLSERSQSDK